MNIFSSESKTFTSWDSEDAKFKEKVEKIGKVEEEKGHRDQENERWNAQEERTHRGNKFLHFCNPFLN